jgi:hypothetical protein
MTPQTAANAVIPKPMRGGCPLATAKEVTIPALIGLGITALAAVCGVIFRYFDLV